LVKNKVEIEILQKNAHNEVATTFKLLGIMLSKENVYLFTVTCRSNDTMEYCMILFAQ